jgi:hypothetical protein
LSRIVMQRIVRRRLRPPPIGVDAAGPHGRLIAVAIHIGSALTADFRSDRRPKRSNQLAVNSTPPRNLSVGPLRPLRVVQQRPHRPTLIVIAASPAVLGIDPNAMQDRLTPPTRPHVTRDRL